MGNSTIETNEFRKNKKNYSKLPQMAFHLCFDRLFVWLGLRLFISGFRMGSKIQRAAQLGHLAVANLFGGSAGREGTAVQMGGAIADQFTGLFKLDNSDRKTLIILGISAGFASVFGTPLAGALFALEVLYFSKISYKSIILSFLVAFIAYYTVELWDVKHTHYAIPIVPSYYCRILF